MADEEDTSNTPLGFARSGKGDMEERARLVSQKGVLPEMVTEKRKPFRSYLIPEIGGTVLVAVAVVLAVSYFLPEKCAYELAGGAAGAAVVLGFYLILGKGGYIQAALAVVAFHRYFTHKQEKRLKARKESSEPGCSHTDLKSIGQREPSAREEFYHTGLKSKGQKELSPIEELHRTEADSLCGDLIDFKEPSKCIAELSDEELEEQIKQSLLSEKRDSAFKLLQEACQRFMAQKCWKENILEIWPAYKENEKWEPCFVILCNDRYTRSTEDPERICGIPCFLRKFSQVSQEAAIVINCKEAKDNPLAFEDCIELGKISKKENLMANHSNITLINASPCVSRENGQKISQEKCIVIHCLVKGYIPFNEQPFPKKIAGVRVDVREAYFEFCPGFFKPDSATQEGAARNNLNESCYQEEKNTASYQSIGDGVSPNSIQTCNGCQVATGEKKDQYNTYLLMGTGIGPTGTHYRGTLGGFVDLPNNGIGFLTCAHVVTPEVIPDERIESPMDVSDSESGEAASLPISEHTESQLNTTNEDRLISQPADADLQKDRMLEPLSSVCGQLYKKPIFEHGVVDDTSVDAAIIEITKRFPRHAKFVWVRDDQIKAAGFNTAKPPTFKEGRILTFDQLTEYKRMHVVKYGSETGLTVGSVGMWGTDVRLVNRGMSCAKTSRPVEMYNQIEISSHCGSTRFFDLGDSGALVFMPTHDGQELYCIGLAIGKTNYDSCLATPIEKVFTKLGLPPKFKDFTYSQ